MATRVRSLVALFFLRQRQFDSVELNDNVVTGLHFPTSYCENEPEPCCDFIKSAGLSYVTTSESENSFLLVETFKKVFNPKQEAHGSTGI